MRLYNFNIVQLAVALLVVIVVIAIVFAVNDQATRHDNHAWARTQLRGMHQGLIVYSNSNKNWYPGIDPSGADAGPSVENRFQILIESDMFAPGYAVSPYESDKTIQAWNRTGRVTDQNYSYAMLQIPKEGDRRSEWKQTINSQAIVMSDRNTGTTTNPTSIRQPSSKHHWLVLWNDNHVGFEDTDEYETKYGNGELNEADRLFHADGPDDALLIHTGNGME